jgi:hypothetical protein
MAKLHVNFRLSMEAMRQLEVMSKTLGRSQSQIVEFALEFYYRDRWPDQLSIVLGLGGVVKEVGPGKLSVSDDVAKQAGMSVVPVAAAVALGKKSKRSHAARKRKRS